MMSKLSQNDAPGLYLLAIVQLIELPFANLFFLPDAMLAMLHF